VELALVALLELPVDPDCFCAVILALLGPPVVFCSLDNPTVKLGFLPTGAPPCKNAVLLPICSN
jgi:hypothetical protein